MTDHLSPAELVDAAEHTLAPGRSAHLESCASCQSQTSAAAGMLRGAAAVTVPEPSPLFWDYFSARVSAAVRSETPAPRGVSAWVGAWTLRQVVVMAALVVAAFSGAWLAHGYRDARRTAEAEAQLARSSSVDTGLLSPAFGLASDDVASPWDVLTAVAGDVPIDAIHAAGLNVRAGAVDTAVQRLSPDERNALGRLLQDEMRRSSN